MAITLGNGIITFPNGYIQTTALPFRGFTSAITSNPASGNSPNTTYTWSQATSYIFVLVDSYWGIGETLLATLMVGPTSGTMVTINQQFIYSSANNTTKLPLFGLIKNGYSYRINVSTSGIALVSFFYKPL